MEMIPSPRLGFLRGVFLAKHLAITNNLEQPKDWKLHKRGPNKQQHNKKNMLRYDRQIKPGLVAFYDIRPGNWAIPEPARGALPYILDK